MIEELPSYKDYSASKDIDKKGTIITLCAKSQFRQQSYMVKTKKEAQSLSFQQSKSQSSYTKKLIYLDSPLRYIELPAIKIEGLKATYIKSTTPKKKYIILKTDFLPEQ